MKVVYHKSGSPTLLWVSWGTGLLVRFPNWLTRLVYHIVIYYRAMLQSWTWAADQIFWCLTDLRLKVTVMPVVENKLTEVFIPCICVSIWICICICIWYVFGFHPREASLVCVPPHWIASTLRSQTDSVSSKQLRWWESLMTQENAYNQPSVAMQF